MGTIVSAAALAALRPAAQGEQGGASDDPAADTLQEVIEDAVPDTGNAPLDTALDSFAASIAELADAFVRHLPQLAIGLMVVVLTAVFAAVLKQVMRRLLRRWRLRQSLKDLFVQLVNIVAWFVGLAAAAGVIFPSFGLSQIVASAGLLSIAIGFAFQDIFENFFAGVLILWRFPFEPGDFIEIESEGIVGEVESIWIRMTLIRLTTGELTTVPNAIVYKSPIRILTDRDRRRLTIEAGVAYGEDVGDARRVMEEAVRSCESVRTDAPVQVFLTGFGSSSMDYEVTWWTGPRPVDQRKSRDEVVEAVKRALDAAGIEIPYPYRTLTFTENEPLIWERLRGAAPPDASRGESGD